MARPSSLLGILGSVAMAISPPVRALPGDDALLLVEEGRKLEKSGQLDAAIGLYKAALLLSPSDGSNHLCLGRALAKKKRCEPALTELRTYIALSTPAEKKGADYSDAIRRMAFCVHELATILDVRTTPASACNVDRGPSRDAGPETAASFDLMPGMHELTCEQEGFEPYRSTVVLSSQEKRSLAVTLTPEETVAVEPPVMDEKAPVSPVVEEPSPSTPAVEEPPSLPSTEPLVETSPVAAAPGTATIEAKIEPESVAVELSPPEPVSVEKKRAPEWQLAGGAGPGLGTYGVSVGARVGPLGLFAGSGLRPIALSTTWFFSPGETGFYAALGYRWIHAVSRGEANGHALFGTAGIDAPVSERFSFRFGAGLGLSSREKEAELLVFDFQLVVRP